MKRTMTIALVMLMAIGLQAQGKKMLVTYFSWSNNTKALAEEIQRQTGADIYRIEPCEAYTTVYQTLAYSIAIAEKEANARPALKDTLRTMNDYDIVAGIETLSAAKNGQQRGIYNLQGQLVTSLRGSAKGLYIMDGQKYLVK